MHDGLDDLQELDIENDDSECETSLTVLEMSSVCDLVSLLLMVFLLFSLLIFIGYVGPRETQTRTDWVYLEDSDYVCFERNFDLFRPYHKRADIIVTASNNSHIDVSGYVTFRTEKRIQFQSNVHGNGDGFVHLYQTTNASFERMFIFLCANTSESSRVMNLQIRTRNIAFITFIEFFRVHFVLYFLVFGSLLWRPPPAATQLQRMTRYLTILVIAFDDPLMLYSYTHGTDFALIYEIFHYAIEMCVSAYVVFYLFYLFTDNVIIMTVGMVLSVIRHPLTSIALFSLLVLLAFWRAKPTSIIYIVVVAVFGGAHVYSSVVDLGDSALKFLIPFLLPNLFTALMNILQAPAQQFAELN